MIAELTAYKEYKPTGSKWLGEIPKHWGLHSLRNLTQARSERNHPELKLLSVERERGVIVRDREKATNHNFIPDDLSNYKVARQGDLVINKMKAWQGSMGIAPCEGIVSPAYFVFRFKLADRAFAHRLLRSKPYVAHFAAASDGVRIGQWDLSIAGMRNIPIIVPPPDEQELIVRFLDWSSVRLGKAIAAKRKVIGLLEEQKQAIIHRAVTRGLDDSVPLKPSGLDWLGDVPCYLRMVPLKAVCHIQSGVTLGKHYGNEQLSEYAYLRVANVQAGRLDLNKVLRLRLPKRDAQRSLLQYGDLLMTEGGDPDKLGRGCIWRNEIEPCIHQNHIFAVRPNPDKVVADFLEITLATRYARNYFIRTAKQTTNLASTNRTTIGAFRLLLPNTLGEQHVIVEAVRQKLEPVDASITRFTQEILLLQEYRTRLIADVVTGKLDVREFARTLPADIAEEAAELASSELGDDEFSDTDDELADELAGEPA